MKPKVYMCAMFNKVYMCTTFNKVYMCAIFCIERNSVHFLEEKRNAYCYLQFGIHHCYNSNNLECKDFSKDRNLS